MGVARPEGGSDRGPNIGNGGVRGDDEACLDEYPKLIPILVLSDHFLIFL